MKLRIAFSIVFLSLIGNVCSAQAGPVNERKAIEDATKPLVRPEDIFDIVFESRLDPETGTPIESARVYGTPVRVNGLCRVWYLPVTKVDGQWKSALRPGSYEPEYEAFLPDAERKDECETREWNRYIHINSPIDDGTLRLLLEGLRSLDLKGEAAEIACPKERSCRIPLNAVAAIEISSWRGSFRYRVSYALDRVDGSFFVHVHQTHRGLEIVDWGQVMP